MIVKVIVVCVLCVIYAVTLVTYGKRMRVEGCKVGFAAGWAMATATYKEVAANSTLRLMTKLDADPDAVAQAIEEMQAEDDADAKEIRELESMLKRS